MKKSIRKVLSLILALAMILTLAPLAVFAEDEEMEDPGTGTVIAVVYGKNFTDILNNLIQGDATQSQLFSATRIPIIGTLINDTGYAKGLKYSTDTVPEVTFVLESEDGKEIPLGLNTSIKGSSFISDSTTGKSLKQDLDEIGVSKPLTDLFGGNAYSVYTADVKAGSYTLKVASIAEPYGLSNNDFLTQSVEVNPDETVIVGESKALSGYINEGSSWRPNNVDHILDFTGFFLRKEARGFTFKTTDVSEEAVSGAEFVLVNRDEIDAILKILISLGKDIFEAGVKNVSDLKFEEVVSLHQNIITQNEDGSVAINAEKLQEIMAAYTAFAMGIINDADVIGKFVTTNDDGSFSFNAKLPAVLSAKSDDNGYVTFTEDNNITLTWMLSIVNQLVGNLGNALNLDDNWNNILSLITQIGEKPDPADYANGESDLGYQIAKGIYDVAYNGAYAILQGFGIVGERMSNGNYLLFQSAVPEGYVRNPLIYTLNIKWETPTNVYVKVANLGVIGSYVAEGFYDFVRNTQYEGVVAKYFGKKAWDYDFLSKLMTGRIALAEKEKQQVEGAFTAFMAYSLYDALGLDLIFNTRTALMEGMNDYLVSQKATATNLRTYVNTQAKKAKAVYTGYVDEDWTFYTLDASPTLTATKLIDKSTKDIAAAFPEGSERQKGILQNGGTVSSIVSRIGNSVEGAVKSVVSRIQEAIGSVVENAIKSITDGVKNLFTSALGNLFGGNSNTTETPTDAGA